MEKKEITVWFSCGAASAVAAKKTIELYGSENNIRIVNSPVAEEDSDNLRFKNDVADWLGVEIETAVNPKWPTASCFDVWEKRKFMSSPWGAPCTAELKKGARQAWENENKSDYLVLGFTAEEKNRRDRFRLTEREELITPLIDLGLSKGECFQLLVEAGIELPAIYRRGYPNANCIGCVKSNSPTYWNHVRKQDHYVFLARADQSRRIGARLVRYKGDRIFLDELPENATGAPLKDLNFECGIFCEEQL